MQIVNDNSIKDSLWKDFLQKHFTGGIHDKEYCIIKFVSIEATIYIDDEFETVKI